MRSQWVPALVIWGAVLALSPMAYSAASAQTTSAQPAQGLTSDKKGVANVVKVVTKQDKDGTWRFDVTVESDDRGWSFYADAFEIMTLEGKLLGERTLHHPHENEQPFTRSLLGVRIPEEITTVVVRARHKPEGYDGVTMTVTLKPNS